MPTGVSEIFQNARQTAYDAVKTVACGLGGTQRIALDTVNKVNPRFRGSALGRAFERQNRALRSFCDVPPGEDVPNLAPDLPNGQCPGTLYLVTVEWTSIDPTDPDPQPTNPARRGEFAYGPIGGLSVNERPDRFELVFSAALPNGDPRQVVAVNLAKPNEFVSFRQVSAVPQRDGPDDCGGQPPKPLPPGSPPPSSPTPPSTDITINLPDIGPTNVVFAPTVGIIYADIDARVKIPVRVNINIPAINVNFDVDFDIDLTDPSNEPQPEPNPPERDDDDRPVKPDCPQPVDCDDSGDDDADSDERDEKGLEVVGAIVLSVRNADATRATEIGQDSAPSIFAPAIGFVNFVYETEDGAEVFSSDIPVKNVSNAIPAPNVGLKCTRVVGTPNKGFNFELFEILGKRGCMS